MVVAQQGTGGDAGEDSVCWLSSDSEAVSSAAMVELKNSPESSPPSGDGLSVNSTVQWEVNSCH